MKAINTTPFRSLLADTAWLRPTLSNGQQETLKWLAIFTMTLDHLNRTLLFNTEPLLLWIGRVAFPLFAFLIAYNLVVRKVKPTRYLWPILIFALLTQPIYMWVMGGYTGNIMFTLYFGILYVGLHELFSKRFSSLLSHAVLVLIFFIPAMQVDYGPVGVFLIPLLVLYLKHPSFAFLFLLAPYLLAVNTFAPYAIWGLLSIPLIYLISRYPITLTRSSPWLFYLFYPAHLAVLKLLLGYLG
jgi:TraX protein